MEFLDEDRRTAIRRLGFLARDDLSFLGLRLPAEIVSSTQLTRGQKIELLQRWALDAHALQRATDENMSGEESTRLDEINEAMSLLDPKGKTPDIFGKAASNI